MVVWGSGEGLTMVKMMTNIKVVTAKEKTMRGVKGSSG